MKRLPNNSLADGLQPPLILIVLGYILTCIYSNIPSQEFTNVY